MEPKINLNILASSLPMPNSSCGSDEAWALSIFAIDVTLLFAHHPFHQQDMRAPATPDE
ncbi:hypothetical protein KZJ38_18655 [Paraburkholderia edwinii]|uniref:Uncharacterized protein n=1 Tax=Paraburkholderia edwinii TaxID=2861782 RepID=A0ABX8UMN5_9BURK|nr:hypothetical protein [Paraburkholderia edwinii]QYD68259.1 hypothetical protein KZJ38_18655 [Paraburkholderia edwinii]